MAFLGIKINHETGRLLSGIEVPGEKENSSEYHITLLCFEDNWAISEIIRAVEATYEVISDVKPFLISTDTITCFPKRQDNPVPIIAKVKSDDLHDVRDKLAKHFDKKDIDFSKLFKDFKPHITLAYADDEIDEFKIDPIEFAIQEIVLWGGDHGDDRLFVTFPLKAPEKHSFLMEKIKLFYKLAKNSHIPHTVQSKERRSTPRD